MAVYKMTDKPRTRLWCADFYCGSQRSKKYFRTKEDAKDCERDALKNYSDTGHLPRWKEQEGKLIEDIVIYYRDNKAAENGGAEDDKIRLGLTEEENKKTGKRTGFLADPICQIPLHLAKKQHAKDWIKRRSKDTYTPWNAPKGTEKKITVRTIARERNLWVQIFKTAIEDQGYESLPNIFAGITIKGSKFRRERRLNEDENELERLVDACEKWSRGLNKYYLKLGIHLLILTGMRKQELFNLRWEDISISRREIRIRKSKMDYKSEHPGRTIALPIRAETALLWLIKAKKAADIFYPGNRIFPMTHGAFSQAFRLAVERAGITDLHIHDLRHEAASWFDEAELSEPEKNLMMGHSPKLQGHGYVHPKTSHVLKKLDAAWMTWKNHPTEQEWVRTIELVGRRGMTLEHAADIFDQIEQATLKGEASNVIPLRPMWKSSLA
jgi:integrase